MSLVSSLARGFQGIRADVGGAPAPWDDYWYTPVGLPSVSGMRVSADTVKRLGTVIAAVTARGRAIGTMPCLIYRDLAGGGKQLVRNHPYFSLLHDRPNSLQTAYEFYQMLNAHVDLRGNAYCEKLTSSRGIIGELIPMHPDHVKPEVLSNGTLRYVYNDPLTRTTRTLQQQEVFHIRDWADDRFVGQSRITMGMDVFGVALAQQDYTGKFLKNDATPHTIITGTNFKTKQDEEKYREEWQKSGTGENRHKVKMLPYGIDVKTLSVSPVDMQLLEGRKASAIEICTVFNILPHLIGVDNGKAATYASVEQFNLMHAQQCVLPIAVMWEQAIQRDIMSEALHFEDCYAKFSLASLLRGDFATRTAGYAVAVEHGWLSPDDVRELEDLNPIAGGIGKRYFRPLNWTLLEADPVKGNNGTAETAAPDQLDSGDQQETGDGGQSGDAHALRAHVQLIATDAAGRCIRREVNAVRRLIQQQSQAQQLNQFYANHAAWCAEALHLDARRTLQLASQVSLRRTTLLQFFAAEDFAAAGAFLDHFAATGAVSMAQIATQGVF